MMVKDSRWIDAALRLDVAVRQAVKQAVAERVPKADIAGILQAVIWPYGQEAAPSAPDAFELQRRQVWVDGLLRGMSLRVEFELEEDEVAFANGILAAFDARFPSPVKSTYHAGSEWEGEA
jgi:hypothetical protein